MREGRGRWRAAGWRRPGHAEAAHQQGKGGDLSSRVAGAARTANTARAARAAHSATTAPCSLAQALTGVSVKVVQEGKYDHLSGKINGPKGTVYEGGVFAVDIHIPDAYPFEPPKMKFTTKIWHPNVSSVTGAICLDILKDQWSPALTIKTALVSLQALLSAPEPKDPQDAVVAGMYLNDPKEFETTAKYWFVSRGREWRGPGVSCDLLTALARAQDQAVRG